MKTYISIVFLAAVTNADNNTMSNRPDVSGWQANPARRGSLDILLNCVFTILACTWSIQHLNVPGPVYKLQEELLRKIRWTLATVFLPELVITQAALELALARRSTKDMEKYIAVPKYSRLNARLTMRNRLSYLQFEKESPVRIEKWTLTHSFYANMGGYYLYLDSPTLRNSPDLLDLVSKSFGLDSTLSTSKIPNLTVHALNHQKPVPLIALTARQLAYCLDTERFHGLVSFEWPPEWLSEDDIKAQASVPWFTNIIAVFQLFSLLLSLIIRWHRQIAASQLEIVTFVFAICAILVYCLLLFKPQDVKVPTKIWLKFHRDAALADEDSREELKRALTAFRELAPDIIWKNVLERDEGELLPSLPRVSNSTVERRPRTEVHPFLWTISFLVIGVGSLHLIAWNFEFPTRIESIFWKVSCLVAAIIPLVPFLIVPFIHRWLWRDRARKFKDDCRYLLPEYFRMRNLQLTGYHNVDRRFDDISNEYKNYRQILLPEVDMDQFCSYLTKSQAPLTRSVEKLRRVMLEIGEHYRDEADGTDFFPPKNMNFLLRTVFWTTAVIYALARISILALSLGALRRMPDSVYEATWADVIPNVT